MQSSEVREQSLGTLGRRVLSRQPVDEVYSIRLANGEADVHAAQTLRFFVFNLELNEGLERSYATFRDEDRYDEFCDHLVVEDLRSKEIVGTYRLQTGPNAAHNHGYYSAQEFDLRPFEPFREEIIELGRACVHSEHRNLSVLSLLWKGIASYAATHDARYLIGCSSVTSQDPAEGAVIYEKLRAKHLAPPAWQTDPLPAFACPLGRQSPVCPKIPKLLTAYLSLGARICGAPALDREFKTIDFLTFLDLEDLQKSPFRSLFH